MYGIELIWKYFGALTDEQKHQMEMLYDIYHEWNDKINVISRQDIDNLYEHHVLHSLAIAKFMRFRPDTQVLDIGTGGGFPGIPLAIISPRTHFKLIDSTGKKVTVANAVADYIGLKNCSFQHLRGQEEKGIYDFVVSRAVMPLPELLRIVKKNISKTQRNSVPNGVICLKGGSVEEEIKPVKKKAEVTEISSWFEEEWFKEKKLIYVPI
jgi:16S rRNA (guanine527-N7)-methyltransferase